MKLTRVEKDTAIAHPNVCSHYASLSIVERYVVVIRSLSTATFKLDRCGTLPTASRREHRDARCCEVPRGTQKLLDRMRAGMDERLEKALVIGR